MMRGKFCKRRRLAQDPSEVSPGQPPTEGNSWVSLNVGGVKFSATQRTLCAFEGSFFSEYFELDSDAGHELHLDFDPEAFAVILKALRAGVDEVEGALTTVNEQTNNRTQIRPILGYLGLEWLLAVSSFSGIEIPHRRMMQDFTQAEAVINDAKRSGIFHHLFAVGNCMPADRYTEDAARPGFALPTSIILSIEFHPDDQRDEARLRSLMHIPWHGDRVVFDMEGFDDPLRDVWLSSKFIFDFGPGSAVKLSSIILFCAVDNLSRSWEGPEDVDIDTLTLTIEGVSDWSPEPFKLLQHDLIPSTGIVPGAHQVLLQAPFPQSLQRYARMLRFSVQPPGGFGLVHQEAILRICYVELFGDHVTGVPGSLHAYPRRNFMFDDSSRACARG